MPPAHSVAAGGSSASEWTTSTALANLHTAARRLLPDISEDTYSNQLASIVYAELPPCLP